jgi:hypothetical protein
MKNFSITLFGLNVLFAVVNLSIGFYSIAGINLLSALALAIGIGLSNDP